MTRADHPEHPIRSGWTLPMWEEYDQYAAKLEYDAGLPRLEAERLAEEHVLREFGLRKD